MPESSFLLGDVVREVAKGKQYIFMVMPFGEYGPFFKSIRSIVREETGLQLIRADGVPGSGCDLLAKIHLLVEKSELIIADISNARPNVFYEIGYAIGARKRVLLVAEKGTPVPTDLKGREIIEYGLDDEGMGQFGKQLRQHLRLRVNSQTALLRDMLEADRPQPVYVLASPKHPAQRMQLVTQYGLYDSRTFGDALGIRGLLTAFGAIMGEDAAIELISEQLAPPDLTSGDGNLYFVGSDKYNPRVAEMLDRLQLGAAPNWSFGSDPQNTIALDSDYWNALYRWQNGQKTLCDGSSELLPSSDFHLYTEDYGIIVRGPHPDHPDRLVMVLAGAHSLGTGAACLAATRSQHIQEIREKLSALHVDLDNKRQTIWVLVSGHLKRQGSTIAEMGDVTIEEVGAYPVRLGPDGR